MKNKIYAVLSFAVLSLFAFSATASAYDMWTQTPDWNLGYDILSYTPSNDEAGRGGVLVADDFMTDNTGNPITDLHWWGSYTTDPQGTPQTSFWIGFWTDVPATSQSYSYPGAFIKSYEFLNVAGTWAGYQEWAGHNGYYYSVDFSNDPLALQPNTTYWVSILESTSYDAPPTGWGWKTSDVHWNDDAVSCELGLDTEEPVPGTLLKDVTSPQELRYPDGHPNAGQSVDMAFKVTAAPEPVSTILFITGGALLAGRKALRRKKA